MLSVLNTTITANTADTDDSMTGDEGGGFFEDGSNGGNSFINTIIAGNTDVSGTAPDCSGTVTTDGSNLIGDTTGCTGSPDFTMDITGEDPMLGPLQDNGGPDVRSQGNTQPLLTHALLAGSMALNGGQNADCTDTDQRGAPRAQGTGGDDCDIGAFEVQDSCGDGFLDPSEECDDGNTDASDGCSDTCTVEAGFECVNVPSECSTICGDGIVAGTEECDDGADNSDTDADACRTDCTDPSCGDGGVDTDEECDDGNDVDADDCNNDCVDQSGDGDGDGGDDGNGGCSLIKATLPQHLTGIGLLLLAAGALLSMRRKISE